MKKLLIASIVFGLAAPLAANADIQDPQLAKYGPTRKLSRALGNIAYGITELPTAIYTTQRLEGTKAAWSAGLGDGIVRTVKRVGWGAFEVVTFAWPTYKCGWRQPYKRKEIYFNTGLEEFPPELGFQQGSPYNRAR
ncbi:exosortase system-associated protein, TIGR04073 family [Sulfuriroseicoccus oceanibius]|uniref:Exosortase system-associated protein, TIGR04073 family n=1 Tax=Sulfuriroseicoccus oceanibius TaxID=2707525 RepID=A0A6B3L7U4_9BACT|nr:exosortase system-associated protein, TIGR04073 family [Sulfuriroseicoccus oceanibius]QQL43806.1 exosortase system-associated protein, TIGR04073 family [Sulfuriroseicoccus oceanibius]